MATRPAADIWTNDSGYALSAEHHNARDAEIMDYAEGLALPVPLGFGGFRRIQSGPVVDLNGSGKAFRNPRGYYESGIHYIYGDVGANIGDSQPNSDIGYAKGPSLDQLVYQSVVIDAADFADINVSLDALANGGIVKSGVVYHNYISVVDAYYGANPNVGGIYHFTAPSPDGPWTRDGSAVAIASVAGDIPTDNGRPVLHKGTWYMPFIAYTVPGTSTRQVHYATAPDPAGPWTRQGAINAKGGIGGTPMINVDAPHFYSDRGRLFLHITGDDYSNHLYDYTDLTSAYFIGLTTRVMPNSAVANGEGGSFVWGAASIYRANERLFSVWQGLPAGGYYRAYGGEWVPGSIYVPLAMTSFNIANNISVVNANTNLTINMATLGVPIHEVIALDVVVSVTETGVFTAGEYVQLDPGYSTGAILVHPQAAGVPFRTRARLDLWQKQPTTLRHLGSSTGTAKINAGLAGYWRLP